MLTIFTVPKPFVGHIGVIQRNALRSWSRLGPVEILILGDEPGAAEIAFEIGARHIPSVERNGYGTPVIRGLFRDAERAASNGLLCYANADVLFLPDLLEALRCLNGRKFLLAGQRINLEVRTEINFQDASWAPSLRRRIQSEGILFSPTGIDYFVFPAGLWGDLLPFTIGRTVWDNWLLYRARARGAQLIDATSTVSVIHQNHDYNHVAGGAAFVWSGPETEENQRLSGGEEFWFTLEDATHRVREGKIERISNPDQLRRRVQTFVTLYLQSTFARRAARKAISYLSPRVQAAMGAYLARTTK